MGRESSECALAPRCAQAERAAWEKNTATRCAAVLLCCSSGSVRERAAQRMAASERGAGSALLAYSLAPSGTHPFAPRRTPCQGRGGGKRGRPHAKDAASSGVTRKTLTSRGEKADTDALVWLRGLSRVQTS